MAADVERLRIIAIILSDDQEQAARMEGVLRAAGISVTEDSRQAHSDGERQQVLVASGDLRDADAPGGTLVGRVRAGAPAGARLVVCTERVGRRRLRQAIAAGLDGLVWQREIESTLVPTVLAVAAGQLAIPRELHRRLETPKLSTREKQVLSLVVMGMSNGEIAQRLFIGETTVKTHLGSAFRKLGVSSRAEAAQLIADPSEGLGTGILRITDAADADATPPAAPSAR